MNSWRHAGATGGGTGGSTSVASERRQRARALVPVASHASADCLLVACACVEHGFMAWACHCSQMQGTAFAPPGGGGYFSSLDSSVRLFCSLRPSDRRERTAKAPFVRPGNQWRQNKGMVSERGGDVETPAAALAAAVQEAAAPPPAKDSADGADSGGGGAGSPKPPPRPLSPTLSEAASESSSGVQSSVSPHYDAQRDVILRLEFLRTAEVKVGWRAGGGRHQYLRGCRQRAVPPQGALWLPPNSPAEHALACCRRLQTIIRAVWAAVFVGFVLLSVALYVKIDRVGG